MPCELNVQAVLPDGRAGRFVIPDKAGSPLVDKLVGNGEIVTVNVPSSDGANYDQLKGAINGQGFVLSSALCNVPLSVGARKVTFNPSPGGSTGASGENSGQWVVAGVDVGRVLTARDRSALDVVSLGGQAGLLLAFATGAALTWWRLRNRQVSAPANRLSANGRTMSVAGDIAFNLDQVQADGPNSFNLGGSFSPRNATIRIPQPQNQTPTP